MRQARVRTKLGDIAVTVDGEAPGAPVLFLHGVYLDQTLWREYTPALTGRTHVLLDMPAHGESSDVGHDWSLDDCVDMLFSVMDALAVGRCILVGHSWGGMTGLRAAGRAPERFLALGLFNTPLRDESGLRRLGFVFKKAMFRFPRLYGRLAARALYSRECLRARPELATRIQEGLARRPAKELSRVVDAVMAGDATLLLKSLSVPALAVIGAEDFVGRPAGLETRVVPGGHITPHESVAETREAILRVLHLASGTRRPGPGDPP